MRNVTQHTFEQKCNRGEWEVDYEPGRNGFAQVRRTDTGKVMTIRVTLH